MKQTFKKIEAEPLSLNLNSVVKYQDGTSKLFGLVNEKISLGTKRKLSKIVDLLYPQITQYNKDKQEITDHKELSHEQRKEEYKKLDEETFEIEFDPINFTDIDKIESSHNYDWSIVEKIAI